MPKRTACMFTEMRSVWLKFSVNDSVDVPAVTVSVCVCPPGTFLGKRCVYRYSARRVHVGATSRSMPAPTVGPVRSKGWTPVVKTPVVKPP